MNGFRRIHVGVIIGTVIGCAVAASVRASVISAHICRGQTCGNIPCANTDTVISTTPPVTSHSLEIIASGAWSSCDPGTITQSCTTLDNTTCGSTFYYAGTCSNKGATLKIEPIVSTQCQNPIH